MSVEDRFWEKANKDGPVPDYAPHLGACWLWMGRITPTGYGRFSCNGRERQAHRLAYEYGHGPIPDGLVLDHLCRVRHCVRPAHLEAVTVRVNTLRGISFSAAYAKQTHCKRGHEFTDETTYRSPNGRRNCRACWEITNRARWLTHRTAPRFAIEEEAR